jgi:hypothetical protein
MLDGYKNPI